MQFDLSLIDIALIAAVVIVVIWAGLKLVTRLILGVVLVVIIAIAFFGLNLNELGIRLG